MCYIDYGNTELVSRSSLVELPEDLQTGCLAKKYKFWGFHLNSDEDSQHFVQVPGRGGGGLIAENLSDPLTGFLFLPIGNFAMFPGKDLPAQPDLRQEVTDSEEVCVL